MKRLVMALMAFVFLMSVVFVLPACAETVIRDGIEVTLMTDKESYDSMDAVNARLTITNTNRYAVQNVSSEITAPDGYMLSGNAEEEHGTLRAGQSHTQEAALYQADYEPNLPKTGDNSHGMLWGLLFVLSSIVLCAVVIHNPHAKRFFSLFLCLVMISTMVLEAVPVVAESAHKTEIIVVSKAVLVNGKEVLLTGTVAYEADIQTTQEVAGPTISGEKINDTAEYVKVREGDKLSFTGKIKASEGAVISTVQVFVYDEETEVPYSIGEKYYTATGVNAVEFDLSAIPEMTIGETFGPSDYALTEGKRYAVMFYATDSNGNGFADMDAQVAGNQGPVISVRVLLPVDKCDHSAREYTYERDEYTAPRITDNGDSLTHLVEQSYKRYCADCGAYLMNIWGSAASQEHTMADGVCTGCGYSAVPMLFAARNSLEKISFESYALGVLAGQSYYISWDENGGSDTYIVNVKLLDGEPAYHDEEAGTSIVLNSKRSWNYVWFTVPETAKNGQYVKVHVYGESNGIQTEAGNQLYLRVGCEHVNSVAETVEKYYPIEGDETHHQCIEHYTHQCLVCGFVLEKRESDPVISEHEFNSIGRCSLCRYEKELDCYHTYSNRTLLRSYYQQSNDSQHYLVNVYRVNCRDCGVLIYNNMPEYQLQNHEFNAAGECVQCNWNEDSECQHYNEECTQFGEVTYSCETLNGGELPFYHWVEQECVLVCADCGEVLVEDWSTTDTEPHDFDSNNTCRKCGFVDEYLIEDNIAPQILSFTSSVGTTVKIGEMPIYRAVVYDENLTYAELCTDDGWTLDLVTNPVSSTVDLAAWSYAGEAGTYTYKVIAVDYGGNSTVQELTITIVADDTDCRHTTYTDYENGKIKYTEKDATSHYYQLGYDRVCNNCPTSWEVYSDLSEDATKPHDFANGDICVCGFDRRDCKHPAYTDVYNPNIPIQYTDNKDGKTHIWQNGYDRICNTCHENMGIVYGEKHTEKHDYSNGDICPCRYNRNNCQHTPSKIKTYNRHLFKFLNEKQHETIAIVWNIICSTCEKIYSEEIDYVGDENNELHKPIDHVWKDGKCISEGCEYACLHPEKNADGDDNYQDGDSSTASLTDNGDGVTHHHVYKVERTCLLCEHSWTVTIDDPAEEHTIWYLDEAGEYKHDANEHWLEVPEGCSCGYRTGKTEIRNKEEHKPQVTYTGFMYEEDIDNVKYHKIYIVELRTCVCGKDFGVDKKLWGTETHEDKDRNGVCDRCDIEMDNGQEGSTNEKNGNQISDREKNSANSISLFDWANFASESTTLFGDQGIAIVKNHVGAYNVEYEFRNDKPKEFSDGYYNISFDVYSDTPITYGINVHDKNGKVIGDTVLIDQYSDKFSIVDEVYTMGVVTKELFINTGNLFKGETEFGHKKTTITISVPVGGYFSFEDMGSDEDVYWNNAADLIIQALKTYNSYLALKIPGPTKVLDGTAALIDKGAFVAELRNSKLSVDIIELINSAVEGYVNEESIDVILSSIANGKALADFINELDGEEVFRGIATDAVDAIEDGVLLLAKPLYYITNGTDSLVKSAELLTKIAHLKSTCIEHKSAFRIKNVYID